MIYPKNLVDRSVTLISVRRRQRCSMILMKESGCFLIASITFNRVNRAPLSSVLSIKNITQMSVLL